MRVDKRPGSGVAKIHVEDDGSYFQVSQVSASLVGLKHVSLLRRVTNAGAQDLARLTNPFSDVFCRELFAEMAVPASPPSLLLSLSCNCVRFSSPDHLFLGNTYFLCNLAMMRS